MSNRRQARAFALQILSTWDFNRSNFNKEADLEKITDSVIKNFASNNFNERDFILDLVKKSIEKLSEIDKNIEKFTPQWPIEKMTVIDRNILRLGNLEKALRSKKISTS